MRFTNVFTSKDCDNTIKGWIALLYTVIAYNPPQALASDCLDLACGDVEQKGYCIALLQGFLSGYKMGYQNSFALFLGGFGITLQYFGRLSHSFALRWGWEASKQFCNSLKL